MSSDNVDTRPGRLGTRLGRPLAGAARLFAVLALVTAVVLPINQATQPGGQVPVQLADPAALERLDVTGIPPDSWLSGGAPATLGHGDASATYMVSMLPISLRLLTEAAPAVSFASLGLAALLIGQLLQAVGDGRPFERRNPRRLRQLALLIAIGELASQLLDMVASSAVLRHVAMTGDGPVLPATQFHLGPLIWAGLLLVIAEAFRRGRELTDDVAGLV